MRRTSVVARLVALVALACAPKLTPPRESIRIHGTVSAEGAPLPVEVAVYERCSPRLYFFERCPGRFLGEAKIAKPGPFLIELDTEAPEVSILAYRGAVAAEDECAALTLPVTAASKSLDLSLERKPCPVKREVR